MTMKHFALMVVAVVGTAALAESAGYTIRYAPHVVTTNSTKKEKEWSKCKYCGTKISYWQESEWDVYNRKWVVVTTEVPDTCRSCKSKDKAQAKLDRKEARLDSEIRKLKSKQRVDAKEREASRLRKQTR